MGIDVFGLPDTTDNIKVFYAAGTTATTEDWQVWVKPRNCKIVQIFALGGGGGGAGGTAGTGNRVGGAGGGGASITKGFFSANMIPDTLYVYVGPGGVGGSSNTNGNIGGISYVSVEPDKTPAFVLLASGVNPPAGGGGGVGRNTAGTAGTVFSQTNYVLSYSGILQFTAGTGGATGGAAAAAGSSLTPTTLTMGGAGGGGASSTTSAVGGNVNAVANLLPGNTGGAIATNGSPAILTMTPSNSSNGIRIPFCPSGGAGGGSSSAGTGGNGGNGTFGCGGGGGGAGVTAGAGGKGGDGLVIITAW